MRKQPLKNIAASVHQRLLNIARDTDRPFNELLQYFAMERFLYRLSKSPHAEKFILKGALMLTVWKASISRPTMDIDLLGQTDNIFDNIVSITSDICLQDVEPDGIIFDETSIKGEQITEDADYAGIRIRFKGNLGTAQISMQIDVGFGDVVVPSVEPIEYTTILDFPAPRIKGYSKESIISEKYEAMVKLGILNSRIRDFFDIWFLSQHFEFDGHTLAAAIMKTFSTRGTNIQSSPIALTNTFANDPLKVAQWKGFIRKNRLKNVPREFGKVVISIKEFLEPISKTLSSKKSFKGTWNPAGPWTDTDNHTEFIFYYF